MRPLNVGLLGFGTVGKGVFDVLARNGEEIARRAGRPIRITWIGTRTLRFDGVALPPLRGTAVGTALISVRCAYSIILLRLPPGLFARSLRDFFASLKIPSGQSTAWGGRARHPKDYIKKRAIPSAKKTLIFFGQCFMYMKYIEIFIELCGY